MSTWILCWMMLRKYILRPRKEGHLVRNYYTFQKNKKIKTCLVTTQLFLAQWFLGRNELQMYNIISAIVCKALNSNTLSLLYSTELLSGIREWMEIEMLCVCILQFLGSLFFHLPFLPDIHLRLCRASMVFFTLYFFFGSKKQTGWQ